MSTHRLWTGSLAAALAIVGPARAQDATQDDATEIVEVIGQTPLGAGIDADRVAANVQYVTGQMIQDQHLLDLSQFMQRNLGGVFVNEAQNNPLQPDLQYRGFVGSPLLGLPQGLAVYQDGVRLNEPFGDTVNWALLPDSAVDSAYLMPGSNPLFGLNAIGGSIALRTRDGFSSPGTSAELFAGSFGRIGIQASTGGSDNGFGHFLTAEYLEEDGWREFSPTESIQLFGKVGWHLSDTSIDLSLSVADTDLIGNGSAPVELLAIDRDAVFTRPDRTENDVGLLNLAFSHEVTDQLSLTGNVYLRNSDVATLNGDDSDFEECENDPGFICLVEGDEESLIRDDFDAPIPARDELEGASINRTNTLQDGTGLAVQGNWAGYVGDRENLLVLGVAYDDGSIEFEASSELGTLDETRLAVPGGVFYGDGFTRLGVDTSNLGLFFANTILLADRITLTLSGRYNDTSVTLRDRLGTALNGDHDFDRFNPALGLTAVLAESITAYVGYSESSRAPSPVELTCADAGDPCRLPNAFLADPPLNQVVAQTFEAGVRGRGEGVEWHAGLFRTTSRDDILFISAGALTNQGFFDNVGRTRRSGVEVNLSGSEDRVSWFANYTYLDASFGDSLSFPSPNNPAAIEGEISVRPGDRLPLIPQHLLKAGATWSIGERLRLRANLYASSSFHLRGDESNRTDEIGRVAVLGLGADFEATKRLTWFLRIDNLFDRQYETFGLFGEATEVLGDEFNDARFLSPAAPRAAWLGMRIGIR